MITNDDESQGRGAADATHGVAKQADDYETPDSAWDMILDIIDTDVVIWDPFYCSGRSGRYIMSKGFIVIHENRDCFQWEPEHYDIIVTNPPYSIRSRVFAWLKSLGKPFAVLVPIATICNQYFTCHSFDVSQLIIPKQRVQFIKEGVARSKSSFDAVWVVVA